MTEQQQWFASPLPTSLEMTLFMSISKNATDKAAGIHKSTTVIVDCSAGTHVDLWNSVIASQSIIVRIEGRLRRLLNKNGTLDKEYRYKLAEVVPGTKQGFVKVRDMSDDEMVAKVTQNDESVAGMYEKLVAAMNDDQRKAAGLPAIKRS